MLVQPLLAVTSNVGVTAKGTGVCHPPTPLVTTVHSLEQMLVCVEECCDVPVFTVFIHRMPGHEPSGVYHLLLGKDVRVYVVLV